MSSPYLIYALVDPRTGERFYVGQSSVGMIRPRQHTKPTHLKELSPKAQYVRKLVALGLKPTIEALQYIADIDEVLPPPLHCWSNDDIDALNAAEMWWIAHGRAAGWPLTNRTDGGDGARGMVITERHRANMSKATKGRPKPEFTEEHRANMSKAMRGKKKSPEHIEKIAAARRGVKQTPESIAKRAASLTGKRRTTEQRRRLSEAIRNSPKAQAQRTALWATQTGSRRVLPPWSDAQRNNHRAAQAARRGIKFTDDHRRKLSEAKALARVGRHFALLLAGLATIR